MPTSALLLALASAAVYAIWNVLLANARDPRAATAVALLTAGVVFAPGDLGGLGRAALVLAVGIAALGRGMSAGQVAGVCLVGAGVLLVHGLAGGRSREALLWLAIAGVMAP